MLGACAVDEAAREVNHLYALVVHSEPAAVGHIGHVGGFDVLR